MSIRRGIPISQPKALLCQKEEEKVVVVLGVAVHPNDGDLEGNWEKKKVLVTFPCSFRSAQEGSLKKKETLNKNPPVPRGEK